MSDWSPAHDAEGRALVERVVDGDRSAWSALVLHIAPHLERWAANSRVLRRCRLDGSDDVRTVMVEVLERLAANDHASLGRFLVRADAEPTPPDDLVSEVVRLGRLDDEDEDAASEGPTRAARPAPRVAETPLRAWLLRLLDYAARDHVRERYGWSAKQGLSKRDLTTDASPLEDVPPAAERPPMTDKITVSRTLAEIQEYMATFPAEMRDALLLWLDEVDVSEIAARLSLGDAARARALVRAGQARLRARFRGRSPFVFAS